MTIDMSHFEAQFADNRTFSPDMEDEMFERMNYLRDRMSDLEGLISFRKEMMTFGESELADLERMKQSLEEVISEIRNRMAPIKGERDKTRREIHSETRKLEQLQREWARLISELEARRRFNAQRNSLAQSTKNAPWAVGVDGMRALPHQFEGAFRLSSVERGLLCDKPGLGKTLQLVMVVDMLRSLGKCNKVLIFTPKQVLKDFERSFKKWSPNSFVHVLNHTTKGVKNDVLALIKHFPEAVLITNYEVWRKDARIRKLMIDAQFDTLLLDEAHNLKSKTSATFKGIQEIVYAENKCPSCGNEKFVSRVYGKICSVCEYETRGFGDLCSIKNVVPTTGTPILNKPQELWPLLYLVDRIGFPSEERFLDDYCMKVETDSGRRVWTFRSGGSEQLLKKLGMKYTARTRDSAGVVMPPQEVKHHELEFTPELYPRQWQFINDLKNKALVTFGDGRQMSQPEVIAWYNRMRQSATWPDGINFKIYATDKYGEPILDENNKPIIKEIIQPSVGESVILDYGQGLIMDAVEAGDRIVVFSKFKTALREMERRLGADNIRVVRFDGDTRDSMRQVIIDDFNGTTTKVGEHQFDVMLCQYDSAGVGLNLHGAQQLLCLDREWNPGKEEQTIERLRRIDSKYESMIHILHAPGTGTDLIDALIDEKAAMLEGFESQVQMAELMRKWLKGE